MLPLSIVIAATTPLRPTSPLCLPRPHNAQDHKCARGICVLRRALQSSFSPQKCYLDGSDRLLQVPHAKNPLAAIRLRRMHESFVASVKRLDGDMVRPRKELRVVHDRRPVEIVTEQQSTRRKLRPVRRQLKERLPLLMRRIQIDQVGLHRPGTIAKAQATLARRGESGTL